MQELHVDIYVDGEDPQSLKDYVARRLGNSLQYVSHGCVVMAIYDSDELVRVIIEGKPTASLQEVIDGLGKAA